MSTAENSGKRRLKISPRTIRFLVIIFCVLWLGVGIIMQTTFPQHNDVTLMEKMGDYGQFIAPATGVVAALIMGDMQGLAQFALGCLANLGVTTGLKYSINETRPNGEPYSFPSGHTSFAFQGAAFIQRRYGWKWGLLVFLASGFVGYTRVDAERHFWWDVVTGAAIGTVCSYIFVRPRPKEGFQLEIE